MNRILSFLLFVFCTVATPMVAQNSTTEATLSSSAARYGSVSRSAILAQLPEIKHARTQLDSLRAKYEREARYNEESFRRQFSEYLQIQRNLPEAILLKRQGDLQTSMERGLAFRKQAEELLRQAERELMQPIEDKVDAAIRVVGAERKYDFIFDADLKALPYLNPALCEDATAFVKEKLDVRR
mgnify:FL=1